MTYLDDVSICSRDPECIEDDICRIRTSYVEHGLQVNPSKCEIFIKGFSSPELRDINELISGILPGCRHLTDEADVGLFGAPVFESGVPRVLKERASYTTVYSGGFNTLAATWQRTYYRERLAYPSSSTSFVRARRIRRWNTYCSSTKNLRWLSRAS